MNRKTFIIALDDSLKVNCQFESFLYTVKITNFLPTHICSKMGEGITK